MPLQYTCYDVKHLEKAPTNYLFIFFKDICAVERCMNGGKCTSLENRHVCTCVDGYLGNNCQYAGKSLTIVLSTYGNDCNKWGICNFVSHSFDVFEHLICPFN